jgi:hypothetical protein
MEALPAEIIAEILRFAIRKDSAVSVVLPFVCTLFRRIVTTVPKRSKINGCRYAADAGSIPLLEFFKRLSHPSGTWSVRLQPHVATFRYCNGLALMAVNGTNGLVPKQPVAAI